ncbi:MAG: NCS2 family permease [Clostridia bacterium]
MKNTLEKFFKLEEHGTNLKTETVAGLTTFFTMAYIIFVNPAMLSATGMPQTAVFMATIIASVIGTLVMAFYANVPFAQAPGMGLNAFFTYTVCFGLGFTWQQALAMVLICGIVGIVITATGLRAMLIKALPDVLKSAIGGGIGLFLAYIGIKSCGLIKFSIDPGTWTAYNTDAFLAGSESITADASAVPALVNFSNPAVLVAVCGLFIILILMTMKIKGAILIGIVATFVISLLTIASGVSAHWFFSYLPEGSTIGDVFATVNLSFSGVGSDITSISETAFKIDFAGLFSSPERIILSIAAIISFVLADIFDTIGTLIGAGKKSGIFSKEEMEMGSTKQDSRLNKALVADLTATSVGALCGTSNVTTYVESSSGIAEGGRTGLTSLVTAIMFLLCIPLVSVVGIIPSVATAPALIVVGVLMMGSVADIDWSDFSVAAVAFVTIAFMPFAYSITTGISAGFIVYVVLQIVKGNVRKVHPVMYLFTLLFIVNFIFLAVNNL